MGDVEVVSKGDKVKLRRFETAAILSACPGPRLRNRRQDYPFSKRRCFLRHFPLLTCQKCLYLAGFIGVIFYQTAGAQVKLPPVEIAAQPTPQPRVMPFAFESQAKFLGTLTSEDQQPRYLGSHWTERFGSLSLWGIETRALEIPALDLGLLDPRFFSGFSESLFASQITLNLYPALSEIPGMQSVFRVGTDISQDTFYRHSQHRGPKRWQFQFSQKVSGEARNYYDDRQTFFTSSDDRILDDPRLATRRVQASLTHQEETPAHHHAMGVLVVQKHENLLPYPPTLSDATQLRTLVLGNGQWRWRTCELFGQPCRWTLTLLGYQSTLQDPNRDLFLGFVTQDLDHATLSSQLESFFPWSNTISFEPKLHMQAGFSHLSTQDLARVQSTLQNWRFQLGSSTGITGLWDPWLWQPYVEIYGLSDTLGSTQQWNVLLTLGQKLKHVFSSQHELWMHTGFFQRSPSFFERFGSFGTVRGNPDLNSEDVGSLQVGSQHQFSISQVTLNWKTLGFFHAYRNLIYFQPNAQLVYSPKNIGAAFAFGSQSLIQSQWLKIFESTLKLNWILPRNITGAQSLSLPGVSELGASFIQTFFWSQKTSSIWVGLRYQQGASFDVAGTQPFPDSWVVSAGSQWKIQKTPLSLQVDFENILDQLSGQSQWPQVSTPLTLPVLERWGLPQRGRVIFASLVFSEPF